MAEARMRVDLEFLRCILHLPDGTAILDVEVDTCTDAIKLGGEWPPAVTPTFLSQEDVVFVSWNTEE